MRRGSLSAEKKKRIVGSSNRRGGGSKFGAKETSYTAGKGETTKEGRLCFDL